MKIKMKFKKEGKKNLYYGFVRAGISPLTHKTIFSSTGNAYLHIISIENQNLYICTGMTVLNKEKIPILFTNYEFSEFYSEKPPKISNNKYKAVNELVQSSLINLKF